MSCSRKETITRATNLCSNARERGSPQVTLLTFTHKPVLIGGADANHSTYLSCEYVMLLGRSMSLQFSTPRKTKDGAANKVGTMRGKRDFLFSMWVWLFGVGTLGMVMALLILLDSMQDVSKHILGTSFRKRGLVHSGDIGEVILPSHQYHSMNKSQSLHSCRSKYMQHCYWRATKRTPTHHFQSVLRKYEALHRRCTQAYNLTDLFLQGAAPAGCQYLVWRGLDGEGNQLISLVSAFVYSLLTKRTLLITPEESLHRLLCEPFPGSSWLVPDGFPDTEVRRRSEYHGDFYTRIQNSTKEEGSIHDKISGGRLTSPKHLDATLSNYHPDQRFFCPTEQKLIANIPWLLFKSNQFSVPGLYLLQDFRKALNEMFPDRAVFLHAARYLLSPADDIWGRITRIYGGYLAAADRRLGIQVRTWTTEYKPIVSMHILKCAIASGLLPNLTESNWHNDALNLKFGAGPPERIAVLMTALNREYHENLTAFFVQYANEEYKEVMVVSPSNEEKQQFGVLAHDQKAMVEMWLLSFTDDIISSPRSTFGHVAHGLAGITPVVFRSWGLDEEKLPRPLCSRTNLPGPCFIDHPEQMRCLMDPPDSSGVGDVDNSFPEIKHCLYQWGIGIHEQSK